MANTSNTQDVLAAARELQQRKLDALAPIVESRTKLAELRAAVAAQEQEDARKYQAAVRAGWTEAELKAVGLDAPARQAPGRPRGQGRARGAGTGSALVDSQLQREARSSVALDRDQTHAVGTPHGMPDVTAGVPTGATPLAG